MEKLLGVADHVFCSTAVDIQGLGKELGSKDNNVFGIAFQIKPRG